MLKFVGGRLLTKPGPKDEPLLLIEVGMDRVEVAEGALASLLFSSDNRFDSNFSDFLTVF